MSLRGKDTPAIDRVDVDSSSFDDSFQSIH